MAKIGNNVELLRLEAEPTKHSVIATPTNECFSYYDV